MAIKKCLNGHSSCIVCFSSYQFGKPSFTFFDQLLSYAHTYDIFFLMDESNSWYSHKVEGLIGSKYQEISRELTALVADYKSVLLFGASMGGYASLLYNNVHSACRSIAISPQIFIEPNWPRFNTKFVAHPILNLTKLKNKNSNSLVFVGGDDLFDVYQGLMWEKAFGTGKLTVVPNSFHNLPLFWHKKGLLDRFLDLVVSGKIMVGMSPYGGQITSPDYMKEALSSAIFFNKLKIFFELFYSKKFDESLPIIVSLVSEFPEWLGLKRLRGLCYFETGNGVKAIDDLTDVYKSSFHIDDVYFPLLISLFKHGLFDRIPDVVQKGLKINRVQTTRAFSAIQELGFRSPDSLIEIVNSAVPSLSTDTNRN